MNDAIALLERVRRDLQFGQDYDDALRDILATMPGDPDYLEELLQELASVRVRLRECRRYILELQLEEEAATRIRETLTDSHLASERVVEALRDMVDEDFLRRWPRPAAG